MEKELKEDLVKIIKYQHEDLKNKNHNLNVALTALQNFNHQVDHIKCKSCKNIECEHHVGNLFKIWVDSLKKETQEYEEILKNNGEHISELTSKIKEK